MQEAHTADAACTITQIEETSASLAVRFGFDLSSLLH